jgi:uncharacterized protein YkwD
VTAPIRRLAAASLALALAACVDPAPNVVPAPASAAAPASGRGASQEEMVAEVARLVNAHRARAGCAPLAWDAAAAQAAQSHSDDMARRGYFNHVSPDGVNVGTRVRTAGGSWRAIAENIASGQPTASAVVQGWLASSGHRANIENCLYTRHGVGHRAGLWTHVFYTPL